MSIFKRTQRKYVKKAYRVRNWREYGCLRCLLLVMCTYPFAKKALTLYLARGEGRERLIESRTASSLMDWHTPAARCSPDPAIGSNSAPRRCSEKRCRSGHEGFGS